MPTQEQLQLDAITFLQQGFLPDQVVKMLMRHDVSLATAQKLVQAAQQYVNEHALPKPAEPTRLILAKSSAAHSPHNLPTIEQPLPPLLWIALGVLMLLAGVLLSLNTYQESTNSFIPYVGVIFLGIVSMVYGIMETARR
jgi:hypothetical protein